MLTNHFGLVNPFGPEKKILLGRWRVQRGVRKIWRVWTYWRKALDIFLFPTPSTHVHSWLTATVQPAWKDVLRARGSL